MDGSYFGCRSKAIWSLIGGCFVGENTEVAWALSGLQNVILRAKKVDKQSMDFRWGNKSKSEVFE